MFLVEKFSTFFRSSSTTPDCQRQGSTDSENSTLLKVAACMPVLGFFIAQVQLQSLKEKFKKNPLHIWAKPMGGNILKENATQEEINAAYGRAIQLNYIEMDYHKATVVSCVLTNALLIYALAIKVIPLVFAVFAVFGIFVFSVVMIASVSLLRLDMIEYYKVEIKAIT